MSHASENDKKLLKQVIPSTRRTKEEDKAFHLLPELGAAKVDVDLIHNQNVDGYIGSKDIKALKALEKGTWKATSKQTTKLDEQEVKDMETNTLAQANSATLITNWVLRKINHDKLMSSKAKCQSKWRTNFSR